MSCHGEAKPGHAMARAKITFPSGTLGIVLQIRYRPAVHVSVSTRCYALQRNVPPCGGHPVSIPLSARLIGDW